MHINCPASETVPFLKVPGSSMELPHGVVCSLHWPLCAVSGSAELVEVVVLDTETAAVSPGDINLAQDVVIELTMAKVLVDVQTGQLTEVVEVLSMFNDPGFPITPEVTELTGITQDMVTGKCLDSAVIEQFIGDLLLVAHNATFDRPMLERAAPVVSNSRWACSCKGDVDWRSKGYPSSSLEVIAFKNGYVYPAHRATADVFALIYVMAANPIAMYELLANSKRENLDILAEQTPYEIKDTLKDRGYSGHYVAQKFVGWKRVGLNETDCRREINYLGGVSNWKAKVSVTRTDARSRYKLPSA